MISQTIVCASAVNDGEVVNSVVSTVDAILCKGKSGKVAWEALGQCDTGEASFLYSVVYR